MACCLSSHLGAHIGGLQSSSQRLHDLLLVRNLIDVPRAAAAQQAHQCRSFASVKLHDMHATIDGVLTICPPRVLWRARCHFALMAPLRYAAQRMTCRRARRSVRRCDVSSSGAAVL